MFKRKSRAGAQDVDEDAAAEQASELAPGASTADRPDGPFDTSEIEEPGDYTDFGAVLVLPAPDLEVLTEQGPNAQNVVLMLRLGGAAVQLQVLAAPRSGGLWEQKRDEIIEQVTKAGGRADAIDGAWGSEVHAAVRVQSDQPGFVGMQPLRFVGVEGPRWLLQATFMGDGADPAKWAPIEAAFRSLVVVRGEEAMPVGVRLTFRPPNQSPAVDAEPQPVPLADLDPGQRITEVR